MIRSVPPKVITQHPQYFTPSAQPTFTYQNNYNYVRIDKYLLTFISFLPLQRAKIFVFLLT